MQVVGGLLLKCDLLNTNIKGKRKLNVCVVIEVKIIGLKYSLNHLKVILLHKTTVLSVY